MEKPLNFTCEVCKISFLTNDCYISHLRLHRAGRTFVCGVCNKQYSNKSTLFSHLQVHEGYDEIFPCLFCEMLYRRKSSWINHMWSKHEQETFKIKELFDKPNQCRRKKKITCKWNRGHDIMRNINKKNRTVNRIFGLNGFFLVRKSNVQTTS